MKKLTISDQIDGYLPVNVHNMFLVFL